VPPRAASRGVGGRGKTLARKRKRQRRKRRKRRKERRKGRREKREGVECNSGGGRGERWPWQRAAGRGRGRGRGQGQGQGPGQKPGFGEAPQMLEESTLFLSPGAGGLPLGSAGLRRGRERGEGSV